MRNVNVQMLVRDELQSAQAIRCEFVFDQILWVGHPTATVMLVS
jgi:hypothetical protein